MSSLKKIFLLLPLLAVVSCSSMYKIFHADKGESDAKASTLAEKLHPMGTLEEARYRTSVKGPSERRMFIYLPAEYKDSTDKRYPVAYLLHGARGNETSWLTEGRMTNIVDSLIAEKKVKPCIIVLPNMNQYCDNEDFSGSRFKKPFEAFFEIDGTVETSFPVDIVQYVDNHYRTLADKADRAIIGLSVGALQSIFISAANPDTFDYVGLFSPMYKTPIMESDYSKFYDALLEKQQIQFSNPPKRYSIYIGHFDFFIFHMEYFRGYLTRHGFPFQYTETGGDHNWPNWQMYLRAFLPECFQP